MTDIKHWRMPPCKRIVTFEPVLEAAFQRLAKLRPHVPRTAAQCVWLHADASGTKLVYDNAVRMVNLAKHLRHPGGYKVARAHGLCGDGVAHGLVWEADITPAGRWVLWVLHEGLACETAEEVVDLPPPLMVNP